MCDAMTFGMAALQASGQYGQGRAANINAQTEGDQLDWQASNSEADGQMQARRIRRAGAAARGETLAAVAASGVKVGEGSALDAERQVMEDYATDEYMAILNGKLRGAGLRLSANNARRAGRDAARAGKINAFTSLMASGASGARASGWRSNGPGFSGTQRPAPVETRVWTMPGRG